MNKKEKKEKKAIISEAIDLGNGRYKDEEVDTLLKLVNNRDEYSGKSRTHEKSEDGWYSGGKYTRNKETTYTFQSDEDGIRIDEHYEYHDDDGDSGGYDTSHRTGRAILNVLDMLF